MTAVLISIDMEGIAGIATRNQVLRGTDDYPAARQMMTDEASAAVAGAFEGGATSVVVNDSHGDMANLLPQRLDSRAELIMGSPKVPWGMMQGIDTGVDVVLFVGYHAAAGTANGMFEHSFSGVTFAELRVNGEPWSEGHVNAAIAGLHDAPVALVCGDDLTCAQLQKLLPDIVTVAVKKAHGKFVGQSLHPTRSCELISEGAALAVKKAPSLSPWKPQGPFVFEAEFKDTVMAERGAHHPGTERTSARVLRRTCDDIRALRLCLSSWM